MCFDDEDFNAAEKEHPRRRVFLNGTLYHQAGNSIVVDVLEAIFDVLLSSEQPNDFIQETNGQLRWIC